MTEMHDVVEMLLNRIKDYPEDFVEEPSDKSIIGQYSRWTKWKEALNTVYQVATDEEKLALDEATTDAKRAIYMGAALKTIMSDEYVEEPTPDTAKYKATGRYAFGATNPNTALGSTILTSSALRNQASMLMNNAIRDEYQQAYQNATNNA